VMKQAQAALERLYTSRENLAFAMKNQSVSGEEDAEIVATLNGYREKFITAMDDDLNTADALAAIFNLVKDINIMLAENPAKNTVQAALDLFNELTEVLGLVYVREQELLDADIEALIEQRTEARKNKDFATADRIRDELKEKGIILEDSAAGVKWRRA